MPGLKLPPNLDVQRTATGRESYLVAGATGGGFSGTAKCAINRENVTDKKFANYDAVRAALIVSRTFVASASGVNGFGKNANPPGSGSSCAMCRST